ncbi:MAG TPA: DUF1266 domain-containing protein [Polyangiales bacterium]|nr:DUF1266 domain-containing protein [Polyangiales bacterium]
MPIESLRALLQAHPAAGVAGALVAVAMLAALVLWLPGKLIDAASERMASKRPLDDAERALLALAAPYARVHEMTDAHLGGFPAGERQRVWNVLARDWNIHGTRAKKHTLALEQLDWLLAEGDRSDPELPARVPSDALPAVQRALLAWDASRLIHVARLCFFAGYIDEATAWLHVRAAAALIAPHFRTYADFGRAFLEGRALSVGQSEPALDAAVASLEKEASSPWQVLSFREVVKLRALAQA